ncbi:MAG: cytochrome c [Rhodobacteraceae bacterium]|nr:cytochrome c [Paracoccaceae bacterium]
MELPKSSAASEDAHQIAARDFRSNCAACHGWQGTGDGPVAELMKVKPPDLTLLAHRNGGVFPAKAVHNAIEGLDIPRAHGSKRMPVWGDWFAAEAIADSLHKGERRPPPESVTKRIRSLVDYLESIQE